MGQLSSLLWKEWREARPYLLIGLGLFLGLPALAAAEASTHTNWNHRLDVLPWVTWLSSVLAVFVAVGVTTTDLRPNIADFWRSRPIRIGPWIMAKYGVGLAVVLAACGMPLVVQRLFTRSDDADAIAALLFFAPHWAAIFSLAFLTGCVIDRPAHAATIGLAGALLLYALPVVVPPLNWMSIGDAIDGGRPLGFVCSMVGVSLAAVVASLVAVRRGWRIESGRKLMYGLVTAAFLLLFASASFQLGTNLPVLQQVELPRDERLDTIIVNGSGGGYVVSYTPTDPGNRLSPKDQDRSGWKYWYRHIDVRPTEMEMGPAVTRQVAEADVRSWPYGALTGDAGCNCSVSFPTDQYAPRTVSLIVTDLDRGTTATVKLWDQPQASSTPTLYAWQGRVYVIGDRLDLVDVGQPNRPRVVTDLPNDDPTRDWQYVLRHVDQIQVPLIPLPGLPPRQRLEATMAVTFGSGRFDGQTFCEQGDGPELTVIGYRLAHVGGALATFDKIGTYRPTLLQRWAGTTDGRTWVKDGLIYLGADTGGVRSFNSILTILDGRGPQPMRDVGHFANPGVEMIRLLPDGRILAGGGNKLWLLGAPPRH